MIIAQPQWAYRILVLLALLAAPRIGSGQGDRSAPLGNAQTSHKEDADTSARQDAERRPLYPVDVATPDPQARRLCDALHTLPQERKAQCCGTSASSSLAGECVRTLTSALRDGAVTLLPAEVDRCAEEVSRQLNGCDWVTPLAPPLPQACRNLVRGQLPGGAHCRSSLECKDGLFCRGLGPTTPGLCAEPVAVGMACAQGQDMLALYTRQTAHEGGHADCAGACLAGQCAAATALDGACTSSKQCVTGTHCGAGHCAAGAFAKLGEACSGDACAAGAACVGGVCVALKPAGDLCTLPFECQAACVKRPSATSGTCGMQCDELLVGYSSAPVH